MLDALDATTQRVGARVYRMGGDEFCLLAPLKGRRQSASPMDGGGGALTEHGKAFAIGASGGYTLLAPGDSSVAEAMREADQRMYRAKTCASARSVPSRSASSGYGSVARYGLHVTADDGCRSRTADTNEIRAACEGRPPPGEHARLSRVRERCAN